MKWLVDHNVPQGVFRILKDFGIDAATAEYLGLEELTNGALVRQAVHLGIECILTQDATFTNDASKAIRDNPGICIVVIDTNTLPQAPGGQSYLQRFRAAFQAEPVKPVRDAVIRWPVARHS